jgi:hypothetical protein
MVTVASAALTNASIAAARNMVKRFINWSSFDSPVPGLTASQGNPRAEVAIAATVSRAVSHREESTSQQGRKPKAETPRVTTSTLTNYRGRPFAEGEKALSSSEKEPPRRETRGRE